MVGGGSTHNLGLMQNQMMILHTGLALFLAGSFIVASAAPAAEVTKVVRELTDEEQEEREDQAKRAGIITMVVIAAMIIGLFSVILSGSQSGEDSSNLADNSINENYENAMDNLSNAM